MNEKEEKLNRLEDIKEEMKTLLEEAYNLVHDLDKGESEKAYHTWYAYIQQSLDHDHMWLNNDYTIEDTINCIREEGD